MTKTKLTEPVDYNGQTTTIIDLDRQGKIEYSEGNVISKRSKYGQRKSYTAWLRGKGIGWEIHKVSYEAAMKVQDKREELWKQLEEEIEFTVPYEGYIILARCQRDKEMYLVIDNSKGYYKYSEYDKDNMIEWEIIDNDGNLLVNNISEFEIDDYEYMDNLNSLDILLANKL